VIKFIPPFLNLCGLIAGILGSFFWFYSLTTTSSSYTLVNPLGGGKIGICVNGQNVVAGYGGDLVISNDHCPEDPNAGPVLQVKAERPRFNYWSIRLIGLGFFLQLPSAFMALFR
jgi:hypothetical protein